MMNSHMVNAPEVVTNAAQRHDNTSGGGAGEMVNTHHSSPVQLSVAKFASLPEIQKKKMLTKHKCVVCHHPSVRGCIY